jgi:MraZ protein
MVKNASENNEVEEILFFGEYEHSLDSQRRIAVPRTWRHKKDNRFIVFPGRDKSLLLFPFEAFKDFLEKARKVSFANREKLMALARFGARTQECRCDKQGRIQIPQRMLDWAGLKEQVMLVGAFTHAQLWAPEQWLETASGDENYLDAIQDIGESPDSFAELMRDTLGKVKE